MANKENVKELTEEELDAIVGGARGPRINASVQKPGYPCPRCGTSITLSIRAFLVEKHATCSVCGFILTTDKQSAEKALDALKKIESSSTII